MAHSSFYYFTVLIFFMADVKVTWKKEGDFLKNMLRKAKVSRGYNAKRLAIELGVSESLVSQWLSGKTRVPDRTMLVLAKLLGFGPWELRPELFQAVASYGAIDLLMRLNRLDDTKRALVICLIDAIEAYKFNDT